MKRALLLLVLVGCARTDPPRACHDVTDAIAAAYARCGATRPSTLEDDAVGCDLVHEVRDETEVYDQCIPAIDAETCEDVFSGVFGNATCEDQFRT